MGSHVAGAIDSELRRDDLHAWKPAAWAEPCQRQGNAAVERCRGGCACVVVADVTTVEVVMVQENVQPSTSIHRRHGIRQKAVCTAATSNLLSVAMSEHKACKKEDARESTEQSTNKSTYWSTKRSTNWSTQQRRHLSTKRSTNWYTKGDGECVARASARNNLPRAFQATHAKELCTVPVPR